MFLRIIFHWCIMVIFLFSAIGCFESPDQLENALACPLPLAEKPSGFYHAINMSIEASEPGSTLMRSIGTDAQGNEFWLEQKSPSFIPGEGIHRYKTVKSGMKDSPVLEVYYYLYAWRQIIADQPTSLGIKNIVCGINDADELYVAYDDGVIGVAKLNESSWIDLGGDFSGEDCAIVFHDNQPVVAFVQNGNFIILKKFNGSAWIDAAPMVSGITMSSATNESASFCLKNEGDKLYLLYSDSFGFIKLLCYDESISLQWIDISPAGMNYTYFSMDIISGIIHLALANNNQTIRVLSYSYSSWEELCPPSDMPVFKAVIDLTTDRRENNSLGIKIASESPDTAYIIYDSMREGITSVEFEISKLSGGTRTVIQNYGSDDPDLFNIDIFNGQVFYAFEHHGNYLGFDPSEVSMRHIKNEGIISREEEAAIINAGNGQNSIASLSISSGKNSCYMMYVSEQLGNKLCLYEYPYVRTELTQ